MSDLFQAIKQTAQTEATLHYPIPSVLNVTVGLFEKAHIYWWAFKDYNFFKKVESRGLAQGNAAVYGAAIHFLSDYSTSIDYIVKVALIGKCVEDLLTHYRQVYQAYRELDQAIYHKYPSYYSCPWRKLHPNAIIGIPCSWYLRLHMKKIKLQQQILKTIRCLGKLLAELFKLSMCLRDVYLISQRDSLARYRACTELINDWDKYQKQIKDDYALLLKSIEKSQIWIDRVFSKLEGGHRTANLINWLARLVVRAGEGVAQVLPIGIDLGQQWIAPFNPIDNIVPIQLNFIAEPEEPKVPLASFPPWIGQTVT